jgi:uncharacterized protein
VEEWKMTAENLTAFEKQNYINLETFRKNGEGVKTPVWFMRSGDILYVRTMDNSAKVKRIRRSGRVRIAPCTGSGKPLGDWVEASAEISQDAAKNTEANQLGNKKYGLMKKLIELMSFFNRRSYATLIIRLN